MGFWTGGVVLYLNICPPAALVGLSGSPALIDQEPTTIVWAYLSMRETNISKDLLRGMNLSIKGTW